MFIQSLIKYKNLYFITTDKRLLKYKDNNIKLINPIDFVKLWRAGV